MRDDYDLAIVGAGIVGLATALAITEDFPHLTVAILEKEANVASHQTGHNSGVIHSGVYYRPGSLKAKLCVAGAAAMYAFCEQHGIAHESCGKLIVASTKEQLPAIEELRRRGAENGVPGVRVLGAEELRELEPHAAGVGGLHVPSAGITSYKAVAAKMAELLRARGADVITLAEVRKIETKGTTFRISTAAGACSSKYFINCAGLYSDRIAQLMQAKRELSIIPFRGEYYELVASRRSLVRNLIYPVPDLRFPFLGVHFTRRITGEIEAGPNAVLALRKEGYRKISFSIGESFGMLTFPGFWAMAKKYWRTGMSELDRSFRKGRFVHDLQVLVPDVQFGDLVRAGSGVRAQAVDRAGKLVDDFNFAQSQRALHVRNVPSPAATASLLIGKHIASMAAEHFGLPNKKLAPM